MNCQVRVPKDFDPELMLDAKMGRKVGWAALIVAVIVALAIGYHLLTRPAYTFQGHGTGTIDVGRVTLDGTYRLTFYATGATTRIWLWREAGICETTNDGPGVMLVSADRCIARLTIVTSENIDYTVEIHKVN